MKTVKIGLFGFGVVGEGIYKVLSQKPDLGAEIKKVVIKHPEKKRDAPSDLFTTDRSEILNNENIDLVVELIDDPQAAYEIAVKAMENGKSVISANKKMIAEKQLELIGISRSNGVSFLYEAAVCGSIPIIRNLEEYFDNDLLYSIRGIVNGSSNYILSRMTGNQDYSTALNHAREKGFAESDPTMDVEGYDAAFKLSILGLHAFGKSVSAENIIRKGITSLHAFDFKYAHEKEFAIKLVASCHLGNGGELDALSVLPTFVKRTAALGQTNDEFNGVLVSSALADEQFFYGKGAGRFPTSSAVLSDISAFKYGYKYAYKKGVGRHVPDQTGSVQVYVGFNRQKKPDLAGFDRIDEHYSGTERAYITGELGLKSLVKSGFLEDPEFSVIAL